MAITIKDIAKLVGVTPTTVSMVVRGDTRISRATREKVQQAIKELRYRPNYTGRNLVKGKTNTIAIAANFFSSMFAVEVLRGIESCMLPSDLRLSHFISRGIKDKEAELFREILYSARPQVLIALSIKPPNDVLQEFTDEGVPVILVEEVAPGCSSVKVNNEKGAFMAVDYLIKRGKSRVAIVLGKLVGEAGGQNANERLKGYKDALTANGISFSPENVIEVVDYSFNDGVEAVNRLLRRDSKFNAVFCAAGDMTAAGVIGKAQEKGMKIPEDLAVVGYDDLMFASFMKPALTTVKQPIFEMGRAAVDIAVDYVLKKSIPGPVVFEPKLVVRESA